MRRVAVEKKAHAGGRDRPLTVAELGRMSAHASPEFELVLRGLRAGLRIEEICALDVSGVRDAADQTLTVRMPSGKLREIAINAELRGVLSDAIGTRLHWRVFETARRKEWNDLNIWTQLSKSLREIGIDDVQPCSVIGEKAWPAAGRARPKDWRTLERSELRKFLAKAPRDLALFVRACQHSAMQREKLRNLTWKDVGLNPDTLRVKADHLPQEYAKVLDEAASIRFSGPLFLTQTGKRWNRYLIQREWPALARKMKLPAEVKLFGRGRKGQWSGRLNVVGLLEERPRAQPAARTAHGEEDGIRWSGPLAKHLVANRLDISLDTLARWIEAEKIRAEVVSMRRIRVDLNHPAVKGISFA
jgi:hypothetical protein